MIAGRSDDRRPTTGATPSRVALTVGALGVVFGDIGTSPLYAMRAAFSGGDRLLEPTPDAVYGVISLVFWTITLVVTVKYVTFIMRADNDGEGGIMALIALVQGGKSRAAIVTVGVFGAALFYGDAMITPAISVLSAVEGLQIAAPRLKSLVLPIALVVLGILFGLQRYGTGAVGGLFGPIMGVWFAVLALSGLRQVIESPEILTALSPSNAAAFCVDHSAVAFVALASVGAQHGGRRARRRLRIRGAVASAYGIAVTGTMMITTILFFVVARTHFKWPPWLVLAGCAGFLSFDLALFSASLTKFSHGGWLPLAIAFGVFTIMTTWRRGYERLMLNRTAQEGPLRRFVEDVRARRPRVRRAPEAAVFLHSNRDTAPLALRANVKFNHVLHETVIIVVLETLNTPHVAAGARVSVDELGYRDCGVTHVTLRFGFRDRQDVPAALALAASRLRERTVDVERALYFLSRITIVPATAPGLRRWRKRLFIAMWRNQADPTRYFGLPDERTAIMGSLIEL